MQITLDPGAAEPSSPPVPTRGLWSRAVLRPGDPVMPFLPCLLPALWGVTPRACRSIL